MDDLKKYELECVEFSPAKLNLCLDVLGKRPDGYHNIRSLMITLDHGDDVKVGISREGDAIVCECDHPEVPDGESNLAWKAARAFLDRADMRLGVRIEIVKRIPVAAGLAGGSGNAAAALRAMNRLLGSPLDSVSLEEVGLSVGSDVPFMLHGGPAWIEGRGERVISASWPDKFTYLVLDPGFGIPTAWAYESLALTRVKNEPTINQFLIEGIQLYNRLEIPVFKHYPLLRELRDGLLESGALCALMSGSGSSIFGVFVRGEDAENAGAEFSKSRGINHFTAKLTSATTGGREGGRR